MTSCARARSVIGPRSVDNGVRFKTPTTDIASRRLFLRKQSFASSKPMFVSLALLAFLIVSSAMAADSGRLILSYLFVPEYGGSCDPGAFKVLAGSSATLELGNSADRPRERLKPGWPEGYVLEAALDLVKGQPFVVTPGLMERLRAIPYFTAIQRTNEEALRDGGPVNVWDLNKKHFALHIPSDLAGHTLTIRALYRRGSVDLHSKPTKPIFIVAPCDQSDSARTLASKIYEAWEGEDHAGAIMLADSMLSLGWSDAAGWYDALSSATLLDQYDKAINYLDRLFQDYGVAHVWGGTSNPLQVNRQAPRDPDEQRLYERKRNDLLRAKAEQEQQQR
jgi:hypothetical protein